MPPTIAEIAQFLRALPLARAAQSVQTEPLPAAVDQVCGKVSGAGVGVPHDAVRASQRACGRYVRWFGGLDTCLTRALVAGALLSGTREVVLHVGFRPTQVGAAAVDGHAWLVVDGEVVELTGLDHRHEEPYSSTLQLPMRRP
jgi:hypothetical protein